MTQQKHSPGESTKLSTLHPKCDVLAYIHVHKPDVTVILLLHKAVNLPQVFCSSYWEPE